MEKIASEMMVGVVLAGGKSRRMGRDKALLPVDGMPMIVRVAKVLGEILERVIISGDRPLLDRLLELPVIPDVCKNCGPLGGIHAVLTQSATDAIFVLGCDTPFVTPALVRAVIGYDSGSPARVASIDGRVHPLCGVYTREALPAIECAIREGRLRLMRFLDEIGADVVGIDRTLPFYSPRLLHNVNAPADIADPAFRCGDGVASG